MLTVSVVDYGVGNLHSVSKAISRAGARTKVVRSPEQILSAKCLLFPGVGAFGTASAGIRSVRAMLGKKLREGVPALGVCLGMQLLCERSDEGAGPGLGLLPGRVCRLRGGRVPHIGWAAVSHDGSDLFVGVPEDAYFYFVHSYRVPGNGAAGTDYGSNGPHGPRVRLLATAEHERRFVAAVRVANTFGVQFHPEKSSAAGAALLRNFIRIAAQNV